MRNILAHPIRPTACYIVVVFLAASCFVFAQHQQNAPPPPPPTSESVPAWRHFAAPPPANPPNQAGVTEPNTSQTTASKPNQPDGTSNDPQNQTIPSRLTIRAGAYVVVRVNQMLSSNRNHAGDAFTATLDKPIVVDGLVVAQTGETVGGQVTEAKKAGRVKGVSQLAVQLTNLTLVDGQQMPIHSQLIDLRGPTSRGRDAGAVATTTGLGAAVGAAANGGVGAAVGAGAGAIAGTVGVLLTRGHPTIIYPESVLTFRVEAPVTISTDRAPQAFHYVEEDAYAHPSEAQNATPAPPSVCAGYGCPPPYYYSPYYGPYPFYYGFAGPGFYPFFGPSFYFGRGGFFGRRR